MLKSPEQYLSGLSFDANTPDNEHLDAAERAFVEKYLGLDSLSKLPRTSPEPVPLPALLPESRKQKPLLLAEREIIVVPDEARVTSSDKPELRVIRHDQAPRPEMAVKAETAPQPATVVVQVAPAMPAAIAEPVETEPARATQRDALQVKESVKQEATQVEQVQQEQPVANIAAITVEPTAKDVSTQAVVATTDVTTCEAKAAQEQSVIQSEAALREKWRNAVEIQMVSFLVAGQVFLLPVEGIQEVVRHMELIKVPQAPEFVAGVINLRGKVTPVVHLSALLTNAGIHAYSERNFIIITGSEKLQLGLIIDKVNSMHMVQQGKIIWNPESKLAEAAEFLNAIVDLDDHVCGMVAPETITRLILPELG